jgi:tetratricopeptide (TPR) repeat protein
MAVADTLAPELEAHGALWDLVWLRFIQARMLSARGETASARELSGWALTEARRYGEQQQVTKAIGTVIHVEYRAKNSMAARELLYELSGDQFRDDPYLPSIVDRLTEAAVGLGMNEQARGLLSAVRPRWPSERFAFAAAQASLAEGDGDLETAVRLFGEAAEIARDLGDLPGRATALLGSGRCSMSVGDGAAAVIALEEALALFGSMEAQPYIQEANELLARVQRDAS